MSNKKQIYIDASALKNSACFRRLWWTIVECYKLDFKDELEIVLEPISHPDNPATRKINRLDYKMAFGTAFHIFLENYYKLKPIEECANLAIEYYQPYNDNLYPSPREFRTNTHLLNCIKKYKEHYPRQRDGEKFLLGPDDFQPHIDKLGNPKIEYKFAIPFWGNDKYDLFISGTIDMIAEYCGIKELLIDHKTNAPKSFEDKAIDSFFAPYSFDIQTMLYSKVYKELNDLDYYPQVMINGIFLKYATAAASKEGIFDGVLFKRSTNFQYTNEQMRWFDGYLARKLSLLISYLDGRQGENLPEDNFEMSACKMYGLCPYFKACSTEDKNFQSIILQTQYVRHHYNPLKFRE